MNYKIMAICLVLFAGVEAQERARPSVEMKMQEDVTQQTKSRLEEMFGADSQAIRSYDHLVSLLDKGSDVEKVYEAILFAANVHKTQKRANADKGYYVCYPLDVASELISVGKVRDVDVIVAAILHDTVRSSGSEQVSKEIQQQFGSRVSEIVNELSSYPVSAKKEQQRQLMTHAPEESPAVAQIQLANLIYNLKELIATPPQWSKEELDHYVQWSQSLMQRLPESNAQLAQEAELLIQTYWDHQ